MFEWLTRRRMVGGLYFGSPGWVAERIEHAGAEQAEPSAVVAAERPAAPDSREGLRQMLAGMNLRRTSAVIPGLHEQLEEAGDRPIRELIVNLLPAQPEFALPATLTRLHLADMFAGLRAMQAVVKARRVVVVTERHDWGTRRLWRKARSAAARERRQLRQKPSWRLDIQSVLNQHPLAHPTILLRRLSGQRLPVGRLPVRVHRMVVDPLTCMLLGRQLRTGEGFRERPVQLFERSRKEGSARMVMATLGETVEELCDRYAIRTQGMQVIVNGMLAGRQIDPAQTRVDGETESISVRDRPVVEAPSPCFACGWCVDVCPTGLNPVSLMILAEQAQRGGGPETPVVAAELRTPEARESRHCIGCGLCSYVCPTRLPLTHRTLRLRAWVLGHELEAGPEAGSGVPG